MADGVRWVEGARYAADITRHPGRTGLAVGSGGVVESGCVTEAASRPLKSVLMNDSLARLDPVGWWDPVECRWPLRGH